MYDGGVLTLPDINENNGMDLSFDFIGRDGSVFTLRNAAGEVICSFGADDTKRHNVSVTIKDGVFSLYIDGGLIQNGECDGSAVKSITVAEGGFIDALAIAAENIIYDGIVKNSDFSGGADVWTTEGNAYVTDDMSGTFMIMKESSSIAQTIEGIESGTYDIHARVKSDNMSNIGYVYAKAEGHPIMKTSLSVTTYDKDGEWRDIYIRGVNIDSGKCEIGAALEQLDADEVRVYPNIPDEPLPDGKGEVEIKNIDFVKSDSNDTFLVGGDINWLSFLEDKGVQYFDTDGTEKDAIQIMAENGANIVRLRLYNDPGKGHGDGVDYLPDGYQNPEDILDLARRAKDKGMQIQLTFHYSDYWSNAETQLIPHEWQEEIDKLGPDATQEEKDAKVEELLYNFTKDFMQRMKEQGTEPEYVAFGNEMHTGLLFSKNRSEYDYGSTYRMPRLAALLQAASRAVKEVSPDTKVILHLDGAGQKSKYNTFFSNCETYNIPYDVIGVSYYPYWYPDVDVAGLVEFCNYLVDRFDKDIMFLETGYSFVDKNLIGGEDTRFTDVGPYTDTFGMSKMGQKAFMEELYSGLKQTIGGRCLGDLYWDPIMIQHEGVGWAYKESDDTVEHNKNISITLFDTDGYKLPAQSVFEDNGYIPDTVAIAGTISGVPENSMIKIEVNGTEHIVTTDRFGGYVLRVPYADTLNVYAAGDNENTYVIDMTHESVKREVDFTLDESAVITPKPTETVKPGESPEPAETVEPSELPEPTEIPSEKPESELLTNGGFEDELFGTGGWIFSDKGGWYNESDVTAERTDEYKTDGSYSVKMNNGTVAQRITLESGKTYRLTASIRSDSNGIVTYGFYDGTKTYPASNAVNETTVDPTSEWQEISLEFECESTQDYVICFKTWEGNNVYVDNVSLTIPEDYIFGIETEINENASLSYSVSYVTKENDTILYVALYNDRGELIGCRINEADGVFDNVIDGYGSVYEIKAFLWNEQMHPVCGARTEKVAYDEMGAYLFVHFTGTEDDASHEQICFSVSKDGREWSILNGGKAVLESSVGEGGVRDPYIVRSPVNGKFYLTATDLSIYNRKQNGVDEKTAWEQCRNAKDDNPAPGSRYMVVWESEDLVSWSEPWLAEAAPEGAGCYWAPECIWDPEKNAFMVFGASSIPEDDYELLRLYRSYTTDFVNFTEPELYMDESANGTGVFDTTIVEDNGKYYRIYKTDRIRIDTASSLDGEWTEVDSNIDEIAADHEGPTVCKINGENSWMLMLDHLKSHGGYQPFISDDLAGGIFESANVSFPADVKYRHGTIMPITREEYARLLEIYGE